MKRVTLMILGKYIYNQTSHEAKWEKNEELKYTLGEFSSYIYIYVIYILYYAKII